MFWVIWNNFTKWSKVYVNGEKQKSTFLNNTRIELLETKLAEGDIITVSQVGSSNTIFRTSAEYIYHNGVLLEYTEEVKNQIEAEAKAAEGQESESSDGENPDGENSDGTTDLDENSESGTE